MTYKLAHAIGWDAGNRNMRKNGRTDWNEDDWSVAAAEFERVYAEATETERQCGTFQHAISDDSGSLTLPYALLGIAGYMVYWMIAHGVFQALTALQGVR